MSTWSSRPASSNCRRRCDCPDPALAGAAARLRATADPAAFAAISPLEQATRLTQPLLMAHGAQDRRVPVVYAGKFHSAVAASNRNVEYVVCPDEGHCWRDEKSRPDFWQRVDQVSAKILAQ